MSAAAIPVSNGRSPGGKFLPGNKEGRGNPVARRQHELRAAMLEVATAEHVQGVYRVLLMAALKGDIQAAKLLLEYTAGKPKETLDVTLADDGGTNPAVIFGAILTTLSPYPQARVAVAAQLRAMTLAAAESPDPDGDD